MPGARATHRGLRRTAAQAIARWASCLLSAKGKCADRFRDREEARPVALVGRVARPAARAACRPGRAVETGRIPGPSEARGRFAVGELVGELLDELLAIDAAGLPAFPRVSGSASFARVGRISASALSEMPVVAFEENAVIAIDDHPELLVNIFGIGLRDAGKDRA